MTNQSNRHSGSRPGSQGGHSRGEGPSQPGGGPRPGGGPNGGGGPGKGYPKKKSGKLRRKTADGPTPKPWKAPVEFASGLTAAEPPASFAEDLAGLGIELEPAEIDRLGRFLALLLKTNETMNLTAVREPAEAWSRHLFDSLTLMPVLAEVGSGEEETGVRVLDVGSGGGLPGIPLAICMPDVTFTLLDSTAKKCAFMGHAVRELGLENVTVVHDRAETAGAWGGKKKAGSIGLRGGFDVVTARAVGRLATLLELVVPFARVGGLCVLTKGEKAEEELLEAKRAMHQLNAAHAGTVQTPTGRVVVVEKLRNTPKAYPRGIGEPKRKPLGVSEGPPAGAAGG